MKRPKRDKSADRDDEDDATVSHAGRVVSQRTGPIGPSCSSAPSGANPSNAGGRVEYVDSWKLVVLTLMRKEMAARSLDAHFRGISLLHAGLKWYLTGVILLAKQRPLPAEMRRCNVLGGSEGLGTEYAHATLLHLHAKGSRLG